jgi:hypothetical protein
VHEGPFAFYRRGEHADGVGQSVSTKIGSLQGVYRDGDDGTVSTSDLFPDIEHRGFVAFAFSNDDAPPDVHFAEGTSHSITRSLVGGVSISFSDPPGAGEGSSLRDSYKFQFQVPFHACRKRLPDKVLKRARGCPDNGASPFRCRQALVSVYG